MLKEEIVTRSPVRALDGLIGGGLKAGEIGVICSQSGVGKTSVLVQLALDKLLQGRRVIHVSFSQHSDYVMTWYNNMFAELAREQNIENAGGLRDELVRNRVLMNFNQDGITGEGILKSLRTMIVDGGFKADALIIDGYDFARGSADRLQGVKDFALELGLEVWYSCTIHREEGPYDGRGIPTVLAGFLDLLAVVITLEPKQSHIEIAIPKNRERFDPAAISLRLDPGTLLIKR